MTHGVNIPGRVTKWLSWLRQVAGSIPDGVNTIFIDVIIPEANWIGHILRRNCLLKRVIEGKIKRRIEVTGR